VVKKRGPEGLSRQGLLLSVTKSDEKQVTVPEVDGRLNPAKFANDLVGASNNSNLMSPEDNCELQNRINNSKDSAPLSQ